MPPQPLGYHPGKLELDITCLDNEHVLMFVDKTWLLKAPYICVSTLVFPPLFISKCK